MPTRAPPKLRIVHLRRIAFELLVPRPTDDSIVNSFDLPKGIDQKRLKLIKRMKTSPDPIVSQIIEFIKSKEFPKVQAMLLGELENTPRSQAEAAAKARDASMTLPWNHAARSNYDDRGNLILDTGPSRTEPRPKQPEGPETWREQQ